MAKAKKEIIKRDGKVRKNSKVVVGNPLLVSAQKLSNRGQRLVKIILSQIQDRKDKSLPTVTFKDWELNKLLKMEGTNRRFEYLEEVLTEVKTAPIVIREPDSTFIASWFNTARIFKNGNVRFKFEEELEPYLLELTGNYTMQYIDSYLNFTRSDYTIRIYDLIMKEYGLKKAESKSRDGTKYVRIEYRDLRFSLGFDDPKSGKKIKHARWPDFRRDVLELAIEEISEKSDYTISWEAISGRRRATETIIFHVVPKTTKKQTKQRKTATPQRVEKPVESYIDLFKLYLKCPKNIQNKVDKQKEKYFWELMEREQKKTKFKLSDEDVAEHALEKALFDYKHDLEIAARREE